MFSAPEGQLIDITCGQTLAHIEVRAGVIRSPVKGILRRVVQTIRNLAAVILRVAPGVSSQETEAVAVAPFDLRDERIVIRTIERQISENRAVLGKLLA